MSYQPIHVYTYEVRPHGEVWQARQVLDGVMQQCVFRDTEEAAQTQCKEWEGRR
jgi:hypothetical protein